MRVNLNGEPIFHRSINRFLEYTVFDREIDNGDSPSLVFSNSLREVDREVSLRLTHRPAKAGRERANYIR